MPCEATQPTIGADKFMDAQVRDVRIMEDKYV